MLFLEYSLMIWTICNKLISFYRNAVSLHIIFVVTHGEIFSQLGHTGPLTVNKMALPSRYRRIWRHIHALIGRNTIALGVQIFAAGANIICLTYATDWWAVIGPVIHGESKSQATRDGAARTMCRCGSTSLAGCQHVGRFCVRVCSLFVCNWRARFKQNIIVLCICRHDMVAIMMSNPGLSNKFDVDPLSNSDSKMSNSLFSRGRLITLPRSACRVFQVPFSTSPAIVNGSHTFRRSRVVFILPNPECKQLDWKWKIWSIFTSIYVLKFYFKNLMQVGYFVHRNKTCFE